MGIVQAEAIETATDADFQVAPHEHRTLPTVDVCSICGRIVQPVSIGGQDLAPRFGADEYLNW